MSLLKRLFTRKKKPGFWNPDDHPELMNPELQRAIEAFRHSRSVEDHRELYRVLLSLTYCVPTSGGEGESRTISALKNEADELTLAAFSDPAALQRWTEGAQSMLVMTAEKLFEFALENNFREIRINPAGPVGGSLSHAEFALLAKGEIPV